VSSGLTVLATSDLHGYRLAPRSVAGLRDSDALWVDNGDLLGGLPELALRLGWFQDDCPTFSWLRQRGAGAVNLGNHDVDGGLEATLRRSAQDTPALLCANLLHQDAPALRGSAVLETAAGPVGVVGVLTPAVSRMWRPALRAALRVTDPVSTAVDTCTRLRDRCRWVVVLAHLGRALPPLLPHEDPTWENPGERLVDALSARAHGARPLADLVVLGHIHERHAWVQDRTAVVLPGRRGDVVARVDLPAGPHPPTAALLPAHGVSLSTPQPGPEAHDPALFPPAERARLRALAAEPLHVPSGCTRLADQILEAGERLLGAGRALLSTRVLPEGPPVTRVGEALARMPMLEPVVVLDLSAEQMRSARRQRDAHSAWAASRGPRIAKRHRWHAFWERGAEAGPGHPTLLPASWAAGYGGYGALRGAQVLADPGYSLVELLYHRAQGPSRAE